VLVEGVEERPLAEEAEQGGGHAVTIVREWIVITRMSKTTKPKRREEGGDVAGGGGVQVESMLDEERRGSPKAVHGNQMLGQ
jgi:hypothetical protein